MHKPSHINDYIVALFVSTLLTLFLGSYLYIRRGLMFDVSPGADVMYIPNKVIANVGMMIIALSFLFGPIVRYFNRFDTWLGYRKEIGIVGAFLILFHGIVSYFFLPKQYPQEYIDFLSIEFFAGLLGAFILFFLFIISFKKAITLLGASRWWFLQRFGLRIVVILTLLHVIFIKWSSWVKWFFQDIPIIAETTARNWLPGLNLLTTLFIVWVVLIRIYESVFLFRDFGWKTKEITPDPLLCARGRRFFLRSLWVLLFFYAFIFTRFTF